MMKDAELHAEEDRKRREEIETRNKAEQAAYAAERMLSDAGDKLTDADKQPVTEAIAGVRTALEGGDAAAITGAVDRLVQVQGKAAEALYRQAQAAPPDGQAGGPAGAGAPGRRRGDRRRGCRREVVHVAVRTAGTRSGRLGGAGAAGVPPPCAPLASRSEPRQREGRAALRGHHRGVRDSGGPGPPQELGRVGRRAGGAGRVAAGLRGVRFLPGGAGRRRRPRSATSSSTSSGRRPAGGSPEARGADIHAEVTITLADVLHGATPHGDRCSAGGPAGCVTGWVCSRRRRCRVARAGAPGSSDSGADTWCSCNRATCARGAASWGSVRAMGAMATGSTRSPRRWRCRCRQA